MNQQHIFTINRGKDGPNTTVETYVHRGEVHFNRVCINNTEVEFIGDNKLTPELLRKLADEIEQEIEDWKEK